MWDEILDSDGAGWPADEGDEDAYAQVILTVQGHAPLFGSARLARRALDAITACAPGAPGQLWGAVVLPETVRLVIGPAGVDALDQFIEAVKAQSSTRVLSAIRQADDDTLDVVLRYSPVWGGALYQVWQTGYHRQLFWTEYKLSNALYELARAPVEAGLVADLDDWPYRYQDGEAAIGLPP